jgi:hypothetical protein
MTGKLESAPPDLDKISTPVFTGLDTPEQSARLVSFFNDLREQGSARVGMLESTRLAPFFETFSRYLQKIIPAEYEREKATTADQFRYKPEHPRLDPDAHLKKIISELRERSDLSEYSQAQKEKWAKETLARDIYNAERREISRKEHNARREEELRNVDERKSRTERLASPSALRDLFNAMSDLTGSVMLSGMLVVPQSFYEKGLETFLPPGATHFEYKFSHNGHDFTFGFVQIFEESKSGKHREAITVPVIAIDDRISDLAGEPLLQKFQDVLTELNHDMLHHYHSSVLNKDVSNRDRHIRYPIVCWIENITRSLMPGSESRPISLESLSTLAFARINVEGGNLDRLKNTLDLFFDELDRAGRDLAQNNKAAAHNMVDCVGGIVGFMLMRLVPFNQPLMEHCLARMELADPDPQALTDSLRDPGEFTATVAEKYPYFRAALTNYEHTGFPLVCGDRPLNYRDAKRLHIAATAPGLAHLLGAEGDRELENARKYVDKRTLDMIVAVAETVKYSVAPV